MRNGSYRAARDGFEPAGSTASLENFDELRTAGDGPMRITNPFAPGAGIELRTAKTGDLQAEQVVAGRDP